METFSLCFFRTNQQFRMGVPDRGGDGLMVVGDVFPDGDGDVVPDVGGRGFPDRS